MSTEEWYSVAGKANDLITYLQTVQGNVTQALKSISQAFTDPKPPEDATEEIVTLWNQTAVLDSQEFPVSEQTLFLVHLLPHIQEMVTTLRALVILVEQHNSRNNEADGDVDTLDTATTRFKFLTHGLDIMMFQKSASKTKMGSTAFVLQEGKMIDFRTKFHDDFRVAMKELTAKETDMKKATTPEYSKDTFTKTLNALTKLTQTLKSSRFYGDAASPDAVEVSRFELLHSIIKPTELIMQNVEQIKSIPEARFEHSLVFQKQIKYTILHIFYMSDTDTEFSAAVTNSAILVATSAITEKGKAGDKRMKDNFYTFIRELFDQDRVDGLKKILDGKHERKPVPYTPIKCVEEYTPDQLEWPTEVKEKALQQFTTTPTPAKDKCLQLISSQMQKVAPVVPVPPVPPVNGRLRPIVTTSELTGQHGGSPRGKLHLAPLSTRGGMLLPPPTGTDNST
ncbi:hypothetical protein T484DRAFT_1757438 [Baffinella frigidus]|nr:hypothetical protein T484DRAFT_1757438 [Cryptophyta sp. CCMP2293]